MERVQCVHPPAAKCNLGPNQLTERLQTESSLGGEEKASFLNSRAELASQTSSLEQLPRNYPRLHALTPPTPPTHTTDPHGDQQCPRREAAPASRGKQQPTESHLGLNTRWPGAVNLLLIYPSTYLFIIYLFKGSESHSVVTDSDSMPPQGLYSPQNSPCQNTGVGSLSLFQGIYPTQGLNPGLPHCRQILYQLSHRRSPRILEWVAYPFSSGSSLPRNRTGISCIAGGFFTN